MARKYLGQGFKALALRAWASRWIGLAAAVVFFMLFVRLGFVIFQESVEPFEYRSAKVLTPKIKIGESVQVVYDFKRNRLCNTVISVFFLDSEGKVVFRSAVPGGYSTVGEHTTKVELTLPFKPVPGVYTYRAIMNSDCGLSSYSHLVPDVVFEVVP